MIRKLLLMLWTAFSTYGIAMQFDTVAFTPNLQDKKR